MSRTVTPLVLVMALVLAGGVRGATASAAPAYRAQADALCTQANARLAALPSPRTSEAVRRWFTRAVPIMTTSVRRVQALAPPRALRVRHRAWSAALGARVRAARAVRTRILAGAPPVATMEAARPRLERLKRRARTHARALGLRTCAGSRR